MKKTLGANPYIFPQPVLLISTYDEENHPDIMNVAYGGIVNSNRLQINIGVRHKTSENIKIKQEFTVGLADVNCIKEADYVGIVSGNDEPEKVKKSGFTLISSTKVDAPTIEEVPITLECKVEEMNQYGETYRVVAEILEVVADEKVLDENGKIDVSKLKIISYDPASFAYLQLGGKVGQAFSDGKQLL